MNNTQIQWALDTLQAAGYRLQNTTPDLIQDNPWSAVYCFKTNQGSAILKRVPAALSIEATVIRILRDQFNAPVPQLIADNPDEHCFLMQDAGMRLHDYFKRHFKADLLIQALDDYILIQQSTLEHLGFFWSLGLPDWRLDKLPVLYQNLIAHDELLRQDGLTQEEMIKLSQLTSKLSSLCENISRYPIKDTFSHCDFHDKNILVNTQTGQTTIIDLGEVALVHPFFSLLNCIHRTKENFQLDDKQYQKLQEACLKPWLSFASQSQLTSLFSLIQQCWPIPSVLAEYRLICSIDSSSRQDLRRQGRLANNLRHWINLN